MEWGSVLRLLSPRLFNVLADLLEWILKQYGVSFCLHYLDDFLTIGAPGSSTCKENLDTIQLVCEWLGIPLALEKVEGPSTSLNFLGTLSEWKHVSLLTNYRELGNL